MTRYIKAWILALGLILTPAVASAQETLPAAPGAEAAPNEVADAATAEATASGLDPALSTPMKPTPGIGMPVDGGIDF